MNSPRILIADDQTHVREALQLLLKTEGFSTEAVSSPDGVMEAVQNRSFDVLLLDMNYARDTTSGNEGLELLSRLRKFDNALPVVFMTAWGSVELAVEAMQDGVRDFVQKPWDNKKLLASLRRHIEEGRVLREKKLEIQDAREIQRRLLPGELPKLPGCEVHAFWKPANEVGGDYFDAIKLLDSSAAFCIADVAGKGLPAALLMSNMQASVRSLAHKSGVQQKYAGSSIAWLWKTRGASGSRPCFMRFSIRRAARFVTATLDMFLQLLCARTEASNDCRQAGPCSDYLWTQNTRRRKLYSTRAIE